MRIIEKIFKIKPFNQAEEVVEDMVLDKVLGTDVADKTKMEPIEAVSDSVKYSTLLIEPAIEKVYSYDPMEGFILVVKFWIKMTLKSVTFWMKIYLIKLMICIKRKMVLIKSLVLHNYKGFLNYET